MEHFEGNFRAGKGEPSLGQEQFLAPRIVARGQLKDGAKFEFNTTHAICFHVQGTRKGSCKRIRQWFHCRPAEKEKQVFELHFFCCTSTLIIIQSSPLQRRRYGKGYAAISVLSTLESTIREMFRSHVSPLHFGLCSQFIPLYFGVPNLARVCLATSLPSACSPQYGKGYMATSTPPPSALESGYVTTQSSPL